MKEIFKSNKGQEKRNHQTLREIPEPRKYFKVIVNCFKITWSIYHLKTFITKFLSFLLLGDYPHSSIMMGQQGSRIFLQPSLLFPKAESNTSLTWILICGTALVNVYLVTM